jgi:hypothetical protein
MTQELVSTAWLAEHLASPDISIIDCSWRMPPPSATPRQSFGTAHSGAQFFDIDLISDTKAPCPTCCPAEKFASHVRKMGIGDGKKVICYDSLGLFPQPASGGCSRSSATTMWPCSTAACQMESGEPPSRRWPADQAAGTPFHRPLPVHDGARQIRYAQSLQIADARSRTFPRSPSPPGVRAVTCQMPKCQRHASEPMAH